MIQTWKCIIPRLLCAILYVRIINIIMLVTITVYAVTVTFLQCHKETTIKYSRKYWRWKYYIYNIHSNSKYFFYFIFFILIYAFSCNYQLFFLTLIPQINRWDFQRLSHSAWSRKKSLFSHAGPMLFFQCNRYTHVHTRSWQLIRQLCLTLNSRHLECRACARIVRRKQAIAPC